MSLTTLPQELIEIIFRHLCTTTNPPFLSNVSSIKSAFAFGLSHTSHLTCLKALLSQISTPPERFREDPLAHNPRAGILIDRNNASNALHIAALIRLSHPFLTTLHLSVSPLQSTWVTSLTPPPPLLRVLSLRQVTPQYPLVQLLTVVGTQLVDLQIVGTTGVPLSQQQINAIGQHARNLNSLALRLSIFENDWRPLWRGVGQTLTHLSIGATRFWIMDTDEDPLLELVGTYCPRISKLHFYHVGASLGPALSALCARYAEQLDTLTLEQCHIHRPNLFTIANSCGNVMVDVVHGSSLFSHAYNTDIIDVLAPRLTSLSYRTQLSHDESLFDLRRCNNLKHLRLDCASTLSEQVLHGIVKAVGKSLKQLSLGFFVRSHDSELLTNTLDWLCEHANNLEILQIGGPVFRMRSLENVLLVAQVREVSVTFGVQTPQNSGNIDAVLALLDVVARCTQLESVVIKDRGIDEEGEWKERVRLACVLLRGKVDRISVCGVEFL